MQSPSTWAGWRLGRLPHITGGIAYPGPMIGVLCLPDQHPNHTIPIIPRQHHLDHDFVNGILYGSPVIIPARHTRVASPVPINHQYSMINDRVFTINTIQDSTIQAPYIQASSILHTSFMSRSTCHNYSGGGKGVDSPTDRAKGVFLYRTSRAAPFIFLSAPPSRFLSAPFRKDHTYGLRAQIVRDRTEGYGFLVKSGIFYLTWTPQRRTLCGRAISGSIGAKVIMQWNTAPGPRFERPGA